MNAPSRRDRTRPAELIVLSAVIGGFVGLVVFMSTRDLFLGVVATGIVFIVTLVSIAMLVLSKKPEEPERPGDDRDRPGH